MEIPPQSGRVRFGDFEADLSSRELRKHGIKIKIHDQPFQVLAMLLDRPGEVVTREELQRKLWAADTFVDFDVGLNTAIKRLRDALGDSAENSRFVETLPRRGYRFLASVDQATPRSVGISQAPATGEAVVERPVPPSIPTGRRNLGKSWIMALALAAGIVLLAGLLVAGWRERLLGRASTPRAKGLAVLPFENLSHDPEQEHFADGMTDALTTRLAQLKSLNVTSRTSAMQFKGKHPSAGKVAEQLGVDNLVEGTILPSGNRIRITAQLIDARHDRHIWANTYERDLSNILIVQAEIAQSIVREIKISLSPAEREGMGKARPVNPAAWEAYSRAQYHARKFTGEEWEKAIVEFRSATEQDPNYADPYIGLASSYIWLAGYGWRAPRDGVPQGIAAAKRALEIDPNAAEAHYVLAIAKVWYEYDWTGAEAEFRLGLEGSPNYAVGRMWHSQYLSITGRHEEAIAEELHARALDPVSLLVNANVCRAYVFADQPDKAIAECNRLVELDPQFQLAYSWLMVAYEEKQMYEAAMEIETRALRIANQAALADRIAAAYRKGGRRAQLELELSEELKQPVDPVSIAGLYGQLGQNNRAFAWIEKGYAARDAGLPLVVVNPVFRSLRSDTRFAKLLKRMNLPL